MVIAPGTEGELGILPLHAPLITTLRPGELRIRPEEDKDEWLAFAVDGGYLEIFQDHVTILADAAVKADEIDIETARGETEAAAKALAETDPSDEEAVKEAQRRVARAENRLAVAY